MQKVILILMFLPGLAFSQVVSSKMLTPPLGLSFGMNQVQVDAKLKQQGGVVNDRKSVSGLKVYENIELGDYYVHLYAIYRLSKLIEVKALVVESENGRRIYEQIRQNIVLRYNVPTVETQFDEELYSAASTWVFKNGLIRLDLTSRQVTILYSDVDVADSQRQKAKNSF